MYLICVCSKLLTSSSFVHIYIYIYIFIYLFIYLYIHIYIHIHTSCDTRAFHGSPVLFIYSKPAFSKPLFSPVVPCNRGTCVHVCHSLFAFLLVLEFTPFPYSLSHSTHDARLDSRRELRSPLADLSSWPYQNIKPAFS